MTLLIRLFWALLAGVILAFGTYKILWPAPAYLGTYIAVDKSGAYKLHIVDDSTATIVYKDRKGKRYGYLGEVVQQDDKVTIRWKSQRVGSEWQPMEQAVMESLRVQQDGQLKSSRQLYRRATADDQEI